ncbi:ribosome small subunit-dependent GTPase A [Ketobacter sp. MCCC 1A13808]|uniref:ribosome small subunit-dependent GTPase A n=1 Tax=Ketobacter sp. MCCC 1A13808 TaxID=2602738 RepID=UPI0012EBA3A3|nr:ribosome small subunit-dependent GTPase A [Ketobacter sp. MCCC 1A13808]MVF11496.1 ribosome small subunit-dependent GTPase A [Ketobacter sp. MCCC 1A13808]
MNTTFSLADLGWQPFFQQQLDLAEWDSAMPVRIAAQHKSRLIVYGESGQYALDTPPSLGTVTVGDWLLLNESMQINRLLERKSAFARRSPGSKVAEQLIAANVDTAFVVCALNEDFNLNRIERYLALVHDAGAEPVVVLTKMDLIDHADELREQVQRLDNQLCIEMVNGREATSAEVLLPWCEAGQTIVLLGSSGAGKSTLTNSLLGESIQLTSEIREEDGKGRHTTTSRALLPLKSGAMIIDTPGMRELQLAVGSDAIENTFADISDLALQCRFADCCHDQEPDCAVRAAMESGILDERRYDNYLKLKREQIRNEATLAEKHKAEKALGKFYKRTQSVSRENKGH